MEFGTFISEHFTWDIAYWLWFALGQCIFVFFRSLWAVRLFKAPNAWYFVCSNKSTLFARAVAEFPLFFLYRHATKEILSELLHFNEPFNLPQAAIVFVFLGFIADFLLDQLSTVPIPNWGPAWFQAFLGKLRTWIAENIPPSPGEVLVMKAIDEERKNANQ